MDGALYSYDGNGNLTDDGVNTYLYDVESQLISATTPQNLADYTYDPQGRRGEKDVDGTVTRYSRLCLRWAAVGRLSSRSNSRLWNNSGSAR